MNLRFFRAKGFTTVELLVSIVIASMAILLVTRMVSLMQNYWFVGTVNLSHLQEARLAIDYLRRDFAGACPQLNASDSRALLESTRLMPLTLTSEAIKSATTAPILVQPHSLIFTRFIFQSSGNGNPPLTEQVTYDFNPDSRTLTRTVPGREKIFKNIASASFQVYVTEANPRVPILYVWLKIHDIADLKNNAPKTEALELTTSISSSFLAGNLNFPAWNFETYPVISSPP